MNHKKTLRIHAEICTFSSNLDLDAMRRTPTPNSVQIHQRAASGQVGKISQLCDFFLCKYIFFVNLPSMGQASQQLLTGDYQHKQ